MDINDDYYLQELKTESFAHSTLLQVVMTKR